jgi:ABC-2 type transport system ATP-binding protein
MIVEVRDLTFDYPTKRALSDMTFSIAADDITAIVGPNGAGKTTLLKCLAGLEQPTAGTIRIDGVDVLGAPRDAHRRVGFLPDFFGLYDALTVRRCLDYAARARGVPNGERAARIAWAAEMLGLGDRMDQRALALSRGLRQRLAIAQTIIHRPPVLLLDEPAAGLDPEARTGLSDTFRLLRDEGHTLLVSSHILAELEDYSTHMLIVEDGRVISHTALGSSTETTERQRIRLRFSRPVAAELLAGLTPDLVIEDSQNAIAGIDGGDDARLALLRRVLDRDLPLLGFAPEQKSLSRFYLDNVAADRKARRSGAQQEGARS